MPAIAITRNSVSIHAPLRREERLLVELGRGVVVPFQSTLPSEVTFPRKSGQVGYMLEVASEFRFS